MGTTARIDSPESFQAAFGVSRGTLDRLVTYENLLKALAEDHKSRCAEHA